MFVSGRWRQKNILVWVCHYNLIFGSACDGPLESIATLILTLSYNHKNQKINERTIDDSQLRNPWAFSSSRRGPLLHSTQRNLSLSRHQHGGTQKHCGLAPFTAALPIFDDNQTNSRSPPRRL